MTIQGLPPEKTWLEKLLSGSSMATILVALVGQALFSIILQVKNNEQQTAAIEANRAAIHNLEYNITNLQTPLSALVLKMEGRVSANEAAAKLVDSQYQELFKRIENNSLLLSSRIDIIDKGTRALELISSNQQRVIITLDRLGEKVNLLEGRVNELRIQGDQNSKAIELINNFIRTYIRNQQPQKPEQ